MFLNNLLSPKKTWEIGNRQSLLDERRKRFGVDQGA
jgi:hypothetical protein